MLRLHEDGTSVFSIVPKDIIVFCIEPYFINDLSVKNVFGADIEEGLEKLRIKKETLKGSVESLTIKEFLLDSAQKGIDYFYLHNKMNFWQIDNVQTIDNLTDTDLRCLYVYFTVKTIHEGNIFNGSGSAVYELIRGKMMYFYPSEIVSMHCNYFYYRDYVANAIDERRLRRES